MALVLYSTQACHLCELAQQVIVDVADKITVDVFVEDIGESEVLVERYGTRIPVLRNESNGRELNWPFDQDQLLAWFTGKD